MTANGHDTQPVDPALAVLDEPTQPPEPPEPFRLTFEARVTRALARLEAGQVRQISALRLLVPRVRELERAANWKERAKRAAKTAAPFVGGMVAAKSPELAKHVPAFLEWLVAIFGA